MTGGRGGGCAAALAASIDASNRETTCFTEIGPTARETKEKMPDSGDNLDAVGGKFCNSLRSVSEGARTVRSIAIQES